MSATGAGDPAQRRGTWLFGRTFSAVPAGRRGCRTNCHGGDQCGEPREGIVQGGAPRAGLPAAFMGDPVRGPIAGATHGARAFGPNEDCILVIRALFRQRSGAGHQFAWMCRVGPATHVASARSAGPLIRAPRETGCRDQRSSPDAAGRHRAGVRFCAAVWRPLRFRRPCPARWPGPRGVFPPPRRYAC